MSPKLFLSRVVEPGLILLPGYMASDAARVMLMAIAGVESNWEARAQIGGGTALGFWQFQTQGVDEVIQKQPLLAQALLGTLNIPVAEAYAAIRYNDSLACAFARLLLWIDYTPLTVIGNINGCFAYYVRNWKPGKIDRNRWGGVYPIAVSTVQGY